MMKKLVLSIFVAMIFSSCVSQRESAHVDAVFSENPLKNVAVGDVSVVVDYMQQKDIANQISQATQGIIRNLDHDSSGPITLMDIKVTQRSYLDGIDPKNSIFFDVTLRSEDGTIIGTLSRGLVGKGTIVSSVLQYNEMKSICETLLRLKKTKR
jgi:hypothetical protein